MAISTHAPLAGRDFRRQSELCALCQFQPTRPLRGATAVRAVRVKRAIISTHAPLAGRDVNL